MNLICKNITKTLKIKDDTIKLRLKNVTKRLLIKIER